MDIQPLPPVYVIRCKAVDMNPILRERYAALKDHPDTRRTHNFHGRFENTYITRQQMPEIRQLVAVVEKAAASILGQPVRCGYWFNDMGPGDRTSLHAHEENDELLSAVYYVTVPENSGDLLLHKDPAEIRIHPEEGMLVLFPPDLEHEVAENRSDSNRLSIAFNFGPLEPVE